MKEEKNNGHIEEGGHNHGGNCSHGCEHTQHGNHGCDSHSHEHSHAHSHGEGCSCGHGHAHEGHGHLCACCDDTPISIDKKQKVWQIDIRDLVCILVSAAFLIAALIVDKIVGEKLFWLYFALYLIAYAAVAWKSMAEGFEGLLHKDVFNENTLMNVASIGAFCIGEFEEGVLVMLLYTIGEAVQGISVRKSKKSIGELLDIKSEHSNLLHEDGSSLVVETSSLKIGDKVLVKVGEKVPVDGTLVEGESTFDYSKLTGESLPVSKMLGEEVFGGTINLHSTVVLRVDKEEKDTTSSKILKLVEESQQNKPKTEKFVRKFAKIYTPIVFALALAIAVVLPLVKAWDISWTDSIRKGLVFLVISCPCALVISTPLSYFSGIGAASRKGVLVKGGNYLEMLGKIEEVCFDKTGTLTEGKLQVVTVYSTDEEKIKDIAGACESLSNHPIANCIAQYCQSKAEARNAREIAGKGVVCDIDGKIAVCGSRKLLEEYGADVIDKVEGAYTVVYVAYDGEYLGYFCIADKVRESSKNVIEWLKSRGIATTMLTGDNAAVAEQVGASLGIDNCKASMMPQEKCDYVRSKVEEGRRIMFVGDGLNDAPAIKNATLGVCVSGMGNDASVEASDMVLIGGNIDRLTDAFKIAKKTRRIIAQNIGLALGVKLAIMIVCMFVNPWMWLAIVADVGVTLVAIFNSMRALRSGRTKNNATRSNVG